MKLNQEYRQQARLALQGKWLEAAASSLVLSLITGATAVVTIFVGSPLDLGFDNALKKNLTNRTDIHPESFRMAFSENYLHV